MASMNKSLTREDVTDMIMSVKIQKRIKWADVAPKLKLSKEWVTAACLGQMALTNTQAKLVAKIFSLPPRGYPCLGGCTLQRFLANIGADRPADLSLLRVDFGIRYDL